MQLNEGDVVQHYRKKQVLQEVVSLLNSVVEVLDREERLAEALRSVESFWLRV